MMLQKIISSLMILIFMVGQTPISFAFENLSPTLLSDGTLDPERTKDGRNDIAKGLEPGAIGNGQPLLDLIQGKLPERIAITDDQKIQNTIERVREAAELAIRLFVENKDNIPNELRNRSGQTIGTLVSFQNDLTERLYLYRAVVAGPEDYLIGFNYENLIGLDIDLINNLYEISPKRLAQYIFHECVPENNMVDREDHRVIYKKIQAAIFGEEEVRALGENLRLSIIEPLIKNLAVEACGIMLEIRRKKSMDVHWKKDRTIVTEADEKIEDLSDARLAEILPGSVVIGEESFDNKTLEKAKDTRYVWLVDPVDGTECFADRELTQYGITITLLDRGKPVFSLFYAPELEVGPHKGCYFEASENRKGAFLNGVKIHISDTLDFNHSIGDIHARSPEKGIPFEGAMVSNFGKTVRLEKEYSLSARYCMMAASGVYENLPIAHTHRAPKLWDVVPGAYILQRAGGTIVLDDGTDVIPVDFDSLITVHGDPDPRVPDNIACSMAAKDKLLYLIIRDQVYAAKAVKPEYESPEEILIERALALVNEGLHDKARRIASLGTQFQDFEGDEHDPAKVILQRIAELQAEKAIDAGLYETAHTLIRPYAGYRRVEKLESRILEGLKERKRQTEQFAAEALEQGKALALKAGEIMKKYRANLKNLKQELKDDKTIVTRADQEIQDVLIKSILEKYPDHKFIAEEKELDEKLKATAQDEYVWVIDPIDGTGQFVTEGATRFGVLITLLKKKERGMHEPIMGLFYAPIHSIDEENEGSMFYASKGDEGAFLNGARIYVHDGTDFVRQTGAIRKSSTYERMPFQDKLVEVFGKVEHDTKCTGLEFAETAASGNYLDLQMATVHIRPKIWDIAASLYIVEKAGGIVTDFAGLRYFPVNLETINKDNPRGPCLVASSKSANDRIRKIINETGFRESQVAKKSKAGKTDAQAKPAVPADKTSAEPEHVSTVQGTKDDTLDADIMYRAELFRKNLADILAKHPDETIVLAMDSDIGRDQQSQLMPVWRVVEKIRDLKDSEGAPLFPNLKIVRGRGSKGDLMKEIDKLRQEEGIKAENILMVVREGNFKAGIFKALEGQAWITSIDDSKATVADEGDYIPILEATTLTIMAALKADTNSIKRFYDSISNTPIDPKELEEMLRNRLIHILPKMERVKLEELSEKYEQIRTVYLAA